MSATPEDPAGPPEPDAPAQPRWLRMLEPFRSEAAAFNLVAWTLAACVVVGLIAVLIRAIF